MSIKPILFNQEMTKAILDGRKTVTRRLIKPQINSKMFTGICTESTMRNDKSIGCWFFGNNCGETEEYAKPKYQEGDILYVRETFCPNYFDECIARVRNGNRNAYKADYNKDVVGDVVPEPKWKPSIHMPKEAGRIFLKVTDVKVERLQDMKIEDISKEGFSRGHGIDETWYERGRKDFSELWDSTVKEDWQKFASSPWVWVIEFERCEKPEGWC